jgi:hypothetical protein
MVPTYNTLQRKPDKWTILRKATDLIVSQVEQDPE